MKVPFFRGHQGNDLSFSTQCQLEWGTPWFGGKLELVQTEGWPKSPEGLITGRLEVSRSVEGVCKKANGRTNCAYHDTYRGIPQLSGKYYGKKHKTG